MRFWIRLCGCPCYIFILYTCRSCFNLKITLLYLNCFQKQSVQASRCTNEASLSLKRTKGNFLSSFNFKNILFCYCFGSHLISERMDRNIRCFVVILNGLVVLIKALSADVNLSLNLIGMFIYLPRIQSARLAVLQGQGPVHLLP